MQRVDLVRLSLALSIFAALVFYFLPVVPVPIECASIPTCAIGNSLLISHESLSRLMIGRGAYLSFSGFYDPGVNVGTTSLTMFGAFLFVIMPASLTALLLLFERQIVTIVKRVQYLVSVPFF